MALSEKLDEYGKGVLQWLDQSKKAAAAVQKLEKAVESGNLRDMEKLRQAAKTAAASAFQRADDCEPFDFDTQDYLTDKERFIAELEAVAEKSGVTLSERDGIIFCYPVVLKPEPELAAVRIDKKLEVNLNPANLVALLKKLQSKPAKAKPDRFIETLFEAYELVRAKRGLTARIDLPLIQLYDVLTLLPGSDREYTILDFTRDIYFLDTSDIRETKKGFSCEFPHSTGSREKSAKVLKFVARDGYEKNYSSVSFTAPE